MPKRIAVSLFVSAAFFLSASVAFGQDAASDNAGVSPSVEERTQLQEILVTARRKSEDLQQTPVSVSALNADSLSNLNLVSAAKITQLVPNISMSQGSGNIVGLQAYIRGIGANDPLLTVDSGVGFYLDGVYLGRSAANNLDLVAPERIEVLRGPQGTLFGRNTVGGAVSIVTRAPEETPGATVKLGYGSFDDFSARAMIDTGQLGSSGITATISGMHRQRNGFVDNTLVESSKDPGALRSDALFGKIHGDWGNLKIDITGDWNHVRGQRNPFQITDTYPVIAYYKDSVALGGDPLIASDDFLRRYPISYLGPQTSTVYGTAFSAAYEFSNALTVKSISSWRGWSATQPTNYAGRLRGRVLDFLSPTLVSVQDVSPFVAPGQKLRQRQFSQEVQFLGSTDTLSYVAGVYYFNERGSESNQTAFTLLVPSAFLAEFGFTQPVEDAIVGQGIGIIGANLAQDFRYSTKSSSIAGFGQLSWKPEFAEEKLELTGGVRYTHDKRSVDIASVNNASLVPGGIPGSIFPPGPSRNRSASFSNWSFLASASYRWTPDVMTYARVSTGYKAGGFFARANASQELTFGPEKVTAYEVGFKAELIDRTLRLNGAAFYTRHRKLQVPQFTGAADGFVPNANATYRGFELELVALPANGFQLDGSVGYTDPRYTSFRLSPTVDITKTARFPFVTRLNLHGGAQYSTQLDVGKLVVRSDLSYQSKRWYFTDVAVNPLNDALAAPSEYLLSARISLTDVQIGANSATFSLFGENLLNDTIRPAGIDFGPSLGIAGINFGLPRTWGIEATMKF